MADEKAKCSLDTDEDFQRIKEAHSGKLIIVEFYTNWCNHYKMMASKCNQMELQFPSATFIKIDADENKDLAERYDITGYPTFVLEFCGDEIYRVEGADKEDLQETIEQLVENLSDVSHDPKVPGMVDLQPYITEQNCLNENNDHPLKFVFNRNESLYLQSDCDPELILSFTFVKKVKLHSLMCRGPEGGQSPKTIKLFINQPIEMDFDSARNGTPVQEIVLQEKAATSGDVIALRFARLQNVDSVTLARVHVADVSLCWLLHNRSCLISTVSGRCFTLQIGVGDFLIDNQGDADSTIVERLILFGKFVGSTPMGDFTRVTGKKGEAH